MRTKTLLAAILTIPLLVIGCNRQEPSPTAAAPGQNKEKHAMASPSPEDKTLQNAPPAAGTPPSSSATQSTPSTPSASDSPTSPQSEPKKGAY